MTEPAAPALAKSHSQSKPSQRTSAWDYTLARELAAPGPEIAPAAARRIAPASPQPFGFSEGLTRQQITALVGAASIEKIEDNVVTVTTAPKPNSFFDEYLLLVSPVEGLAKVVAIGKTIETSDSGAELRSNFRDVVEGVSQKYGAPAHTFDFCNGGTGCDSSEYWTLSLQEMNRTLAASWDSEQILVETKSLGMNSGYVTFSVEFPSFAAYANRKKAKQNDTF